MNTKKLATDIGNFLKKHDLVVAVNPDHPYLVKAPDLLVAHPGNLVAVFIPNASERTDADELLVRLTLARLALAPHSRCVVMIDSESMPSGFDKILVNFHEALELRECSRLVAFTRDKNAGKSIEPVPPELRQKAFQQCEVLFSESSKRLGKDTGKDYFSPQQFIREMNREYQPLSLKRWSNTAELKTPSLVSSGDSLMGAVNFSGKPSFAEKLRPFYFSSMMRHYHLDNGSLYATHPYEMNILVADSVPTERFDPLKPLRVAAFTGWSIIKLKSLKDLWDFENRLGKHLLGITMI